MPNEPSEELRQVFDELRNAEAKAGAQARHADEPTKHYRTSARVIIWILLFSFGLVLVYFWNEYSVYGLLFPP